jgi:hypothetical protein
VIRFTSPGATVPIAIDRSFDYRLVPETLTGGPDAATAILSTGRSRDGEPGHARTKGRVQRRVFRIGGPSWRVMRVTED